MEKEIFIFILQSRPRPAPTLSLTREWGREGRPKEKTEVWNGVKRNGKREPRHSLLAPRNRTEKERAKERERARDARPNERDKERTPQGTKRNAVTEGTEGKRKKKETGKGPKRDFHSDIIYRFCSLWIPFLYYLPISSFLTGSIIERGQEGRKMCESN